MLRSGRATFTMLLCLATSLAYGQGRGKTPERPGAGKSAGANKTERPPAGKAGEKPAGSREGSGSREGTGRTEGTGSREGLPGAKSGASAPGGAWSDRSHSGRQSGESPTGAEGAAAGSAAAKNKAPKATGAEGAAAGAAAVNRKGPTATGAEGAAAGAAAANRKGPTATGAEGAAAGAAAANRNSPEYSGAAGAATGYAAVRNSAKQSNVYGAQWYGNNPGAWAPAGGAPAAAYAATPWGAVASHAGYANASPVNYNYGGNVNYQGGNVLVDNQPVGTAQEFSQQASDLAATGASAELSDNDEWLPLGVFALVHNEHQHPQLILQFSINKQGILRGNYTDEVTGQTSPIQGSVDQQTQRAAWTVGENHKSVMEAGLKNLTEGEAPVLIHRNSRTDHWLLVRLEQPDEAQQ